MSTNPRRLATLVATTLAGLAGLAGLAAQAQADGWHHHHGRDRGLEPGNLVISRSVYQTANIQPGVTELPPGCVGSACAPASTDGAYPYVFNNDQVDGSFGITSPLFLDEFSSRGSLVKTIDVPTDKLVTSFSSKSEGALNVSTDGKDLTFMDYVAPIDTIDASNANTPGVIDPTNPVPGAYYRAVAELNDRGRFHFTETNAYSGNNGRAAILNNSANVVYTAGNAGNGSNPQPDGVILGAGAQILTPTDGSETGQTPGAPTPFASFNITEIPPNTKADKIGKDDNFRGLTIYHNVVYYTKGSGGNGIDTVYFVDTTDKACPNGTGLPQPGAALPTSPLAYNAATLQTNGLPSNMCVLKGFNTTLAKSSTNSFPFGLWFANPTTLYVADEGNGDTTYSAATSSYTGAAAQTTAGLQKWVFNSTTQSWQLAYTLQNGLNLGQPYTVPGYPTGNNAATSLPWAPATDGLRNITGRVNRDGTATIWAVTSTVSGSGDQGADPNKVMQINDNLAATTAGSESFRTFDSASFGDVLRGVSVTPPNGGDEGARGGR